MMYRIHYPEIPNMGDLLNKNMLEELFGIKVEAVPAIRSNISAIGSGLSATQWSSSVGSRMKQMVYHFFAPKVHYVWGTGFLSYNKQRDYPFYFKRMVFCSVRGNLTKNRVESIIGKTLDIPTGDGGLLAQMWAGNVPKRFSLGIIPHFKEKDHPLVCEMKKHYDNSIIINLSGDPKTVIHNIASCEVILSSSLHGLIVADSYHIPNMHIQLFPFGSRMWGDGYKFEDYYSSFGMHDEVAVIENGEFPSVEEIVAKYKMDHDEIEKKKEQIFKAFPRI